MFRVKIVSESDRNLLMSIMATHKSVNVQGMLSARLKRRLAFLNSFGMIAVVYHYRFTRILIANEYVGRTSICMFGTMIMKRLVPLLCALSKIRTQPRMLVCNRYRYCNTAIVKHFRSHIGHMSIS
jgi:hypothetical protein